MRVIFTMDEGLAHEIQTGWGADDVASLQNAIKICVKNKDTEAVDASEIEVYPLGINITNFEEAEPLKPTDKLPHGSGKKNSIFVHVPREKQDLSAEQRRLYSMRPPSPSKDPVEVTVRCPDDKQFQAIVDPTHRIIDLKKQFEKDSGVLAKNQSLYLDGEELLNQKTAGASGIEDGDVVDLIPKTIQVIVRPPDGNNIPVTMRPSQKIQFIKEEVAFETGIEVPEQILTYDGVELPNEKTAREMGLENGSVIDLQPNAMQVFVRTPDGNTVPVTMYPSDTVQFIKEEVEEETGIEVPPEQVLTYEGEALPNEKTAKQLGLKDGAILDLEPMAMQVYVRPLEGDPIPVTMFPSDTIEFIKEEVEEATGMPVEQQVLTHKEQELPNEKTAEEMGLKDGDVIDLEPMAMQVYVRTPDGNTIPVTMFPSDTVEFIKEEVAPESGIEVDNQVLKHEGRVLPNEKTADDLGLKDGSILDLEPKSMKINVRTPNGKTIPVTMKPTDPIEFIKEEVAPQTGIAVPNQVLTYKGRELPNGETAEDMGLKDGCTVDLKPDTILVNAKTPDGETIYVRMKPSDTIEFIKEKVAPETGIEVSNQKLTFNGQELPNEDTADDVGLKDGSTLYLERHEIEVHVRTPDGKTFPVSMKLSDPIEFIKEEVAPQTGIAVPNQILTYRGKDLPDNATADEVGLKNGSILDLQPDTILVNVKTPEGETIFVRMKPSDTIGFVKKKVEPEARIEVYNQILTFNGRELPNDETADDVGLQDGSTLYLQRETIQVNVETPDGDTIPVRMKPSDTIEFIKENVAPETGVEVPNQILTFKGRELPNHKTADDVGLQDGSTLYLRPNTIQVYVETPSGDTIPVRMKPSDTIEFIKENVAPQAGIEVPNQILKYKGQELPNDKTAEDVGLQDGSTLYLKPGTIEVLVETPHGETIFVTMKPSDKILFIKEKVAADTGVEVPRQILKYNGTELPDPKTADEMGLKHGSIIDLMLKYTPTPFDMSKNRVFYQLGDTVPYYIRINGWEGVGVFKQRILETRGKRNCPYLKGVTDPSMLKVFPPGQDPEIGTGLRADEDIPGNSSFEAPLLVLKEGDYSSYHKEEKKMDLSIQDQVKQRIAARRRVSCS